MTSGTASSTCWRDIGARLWRRTVAPAVKTWRAQAPGGYGNLLFPRNEGLVDRDKELLAVVTIC